MKKIMVISDTHGEIDEMLEQYNKLNDPDMIIHLGDYALDAKKIEREIGTTVVSVKGNMDGENSEVPHRIIEVEGYKILLTHGHKEKVKEGLTNLYYKALSLSCDIVLFGHTHIPLKIQEGSIFFINPGSITFPRGGSKSSYALITLQAEAVEAEIVYF
ncbi:MAG: metallophosphoesterase [Clostridiales bacterium]|nr:metallophosphoesterase [Clostridiales bacterium]